MCYLRQPKILLDDSKAYRHPRESERETMIENDLKHNTRLEDAFFKVVVADPYQIIAVQSNIYGSDVKVPYFIKFNPKTTLEMPKRIQHEVTKPIATILSLSNSRYYQTDRLSYP